MPRQATIERQTKETDLQLTLNLDGQGNFSGATGIGFFDHMLTALVFHSRMDLELRVNRSDLEVDAHHTVEDVGIVLGQALREALGDKAGINRYGFFCLPMDDALAEASLDLGGRFWFGLSDALGADYAFGRERVGEFETELVAEFWRSLALNAGLNLHLRVLAGRNTHHVIEAIFKSTGRALRMALESDPRLAGQVPSTKGQLEEA